MIDTHDVTLFKLCRAAASHNFIYKSSSFSGLFPVILFFTRQMKIKTFSSGCKQGANVRQTATRSLAEIRCFVGRRDGENDGARQLKMGSVGDAETGGTAGKGGGLVKRSWGVARAEL